MENLIDSLKNLGLSRYEAKAYIWLTKIITGNADEIAEISDLPRSRVYDILNGLEKKGFVSIQRQRPLKYEAVEPNVIFKKEKEELISELNKTEQKLEEYYTNQISEIQAPVWLIHYPENIIEKEMSLIKKAEKSLTMRIGFLLPGEGELMVKVMNNLSKNVKIRILANPECCVDDEKIDIYMPNWFDSSKCIMNSLIWLMIKIFFGWWLNFLNSLNYLFYDLKSFNEK